MNVENSIDAIKVLKGLSSHRELKLELILVLYGLVYNNRKYMQEPLHGYAKGPRAQTSNQVNNIYFYF